MNRGGSTIRNQADDDVDAIRRLMEFHRDNDQRLISLQAMYAVDEILDASTTPMLFTKAPSACYQARPDLVRG